MMINEEDHIRLQAVTAGWSIDVARSFAEPVLEHLGARLEFASVPEFGFVSASPYNCGLGRRLSAMFHLIGLAQARRLPAVLQALAEKSITARGLFGESSRAVGAFVQVSTTGSGLADFVGAAEYLMREERAARDLFTETKLKTKVEEAFNFAKSQKSLSLADALRVLAWARWASASGEVGPLHNTREADSILSRLDLRSEGEDSGIARADFLRKSFRL
jgi:protein arginine kinase